MATTSKRSQDDEDTERGSQNERSSSNGQGARVGRGSQVGQNGAAQKRVLSRAARVLNEIEVRIHELREELEE